MSAAHWDSRESKREAQIWNGRETNVTGSVFCFCAKRAFPHNGLPRVTEGAHQQKVKALITWIKAAGMALFKNSPSFRLRVREAKRFQSVLGREQFCVVYKIHYSLHSWQNCKMIWLKGGNGASFNNNSSQFISTKLRFSYATKGNFPCCTAEGQFSVVADHIYAFWLHHLFVTVYDYYSLLLPAYDFWLNCSQSVFQNNTKAFSPRKYETHSGFHQWNLVEKDLRNNYVSAYYVLHTGGIDALQSSQAEKGHYAACCWVK